MPQRADATYSVLGYDRATGTFGGAVASCVPLDTVELVYAATPAAAEARGAVMTQSYLLDGAQANAVDALGSGTTADEVVSALIDPAYDAAFPLRQYAVVDESGGITAFTGDGALAVATHRTFEVGTYVGSVQGNLLTDEDVVLLASSAFASAEHCGLGERLLRALEAAGETPHGDSRCIVHGKPALAATLGLDAPTGQPVRLGVETAEDDGEHPVALLRVAFDSLGEDPCEPTEPPPNGSGGSGGSGGTGPQDETEAPGGCGVARVDGTSTIGAWGLALAIAWGLARTRGRDA